MLDRAEYSAFQSTLNSPIVSYRIHRRKLIENCGGPVECQRRHSSGVGSRDGVSPSPVWRGLGPQKQIFDFVLRNVEFLCILDSGAGIIVQQQYCSHDAHDRLTLAHQCRRQIDQCYPSFTIVLLCCQMSPLQYSVFM